MMTHPALQQAVRQQALALGLAAVVTAGVLSGLLGLSHGEQAAQLAQQMLVAPQVVATVPLDGAA